MINNLNSTPSFGSTRLPYDNTLVHKYLEPLNRYFEVKDFPGEKLAQKVADKIDFNQAGWTNLEKEVMVVGKDGGDGGADRFIYRLLKKVNPEAKYIDDVKPVQVDGPVIDLEI
ncbi:hypothetical protein IJZ97_00545 [bacterium]|nr:hypothetical protein [bacterium]